MGEFRPVPDPSGARQPPRRYPPTAVGVETPEPEPVPSRRTRFARLWASNPSVLSDALRGIIEVPVWIGRSAKELYRSWKVWHRGRFPRRPDKPKGSARA
jgi:hypothetical protein